MPDSRQRPRRAPRPPGPAGTRPTPPGRRAAYSARRGRPRHRPRSRPGRSPKWCAAGSGTPRSPTSRARSTRSPPPIGRPKSRGAGGDPPPPARRRRPQRGGRGRGGRRGRAALGGGPPRRHGELPPRRSPLRRVGRPRGRSRPGGGGGDRRAARRGVHRRSRRRGPLQRPPHCRLGPGRPAPGAVLHRLPLRPPSPRPGLHRRRGRGAHRCPRGAPLRVRPASTWPGWRAAATRATGSSTCSRGTWPPGSCW